MTFLQALQMYLVDVLPALLLGFFLSGLIHEFFPSSWIEKYLGQSNIRSVLYATVAGTILPICCWGSLPMAVAFYKKGSRLGAVLAFLVATPATSVTALLISYRLLGPAFAVYEFFAVIIIGIVVGVVGNMFSQTRESSEEKTCSDCAAEDSDTGKSFTGRWHSALRFAFRDLPKDIGLETLAGIILAAVVISFAPIGEWIQQYLTGGAGYLFSVVFGLTMYICATGTVPLVDAFLDQGLNLGAGMTLLLIGPVTSYATILVVRKKFGMTVLLTYLGVVTVLSVLLGIFFTLL